MMPRVYGVSFYYLFPIYRYLKFELWISIIQISDITNSAHLLISIIRIMDIHNSARFMDITNSNYGYY